jgi:pimeloyl-ACP methyl ester carboxylesterase
VLGAKIRQVSNPKTVPPADAPLRLPRYANGCQCAYLLALLLVSLFIVREQLMALRIVLGLLAMAITVAACTVTRESGEPQVPRVLETEVDAVDVTLHVRTAGPADSAVVLIAIHGGPGMSSDYMTSLERLAGDQLAVVTYDQRGTGRSSSPPPDVAAYTLDKYVADLDAIREVISREKVHLLGHSWGGIVALRYATVHPERVETLILMGSGAPSREALEEGEMHMAQSRARLQDQGIIPRTIETLDDVLPGYFSDPTFPIPEELRYLHYSPTAEKLTREALGQFDFSDQVGQLEHPVLLLYGKDDPFGLAMAEATRAALSHAAVEFVLLEDCGHFWQECPDRFFSHVKQFLDLP